jgi:two-component system, cell cycle sensor histidine kinase and response regulator CckA
MSGLVNPTVLFVDDDVVGRQLLSFLFRDAGYDTLEAGTGNEALDLARSHHPELMVLDVNLPDMDGFEVCHRLKSQPETTHIAVLQVSAVYVGGGDRAHGLEEGADAYLIKPVEPREILATVRALLRVRQAEEAARHAAQQWRTTFDAFSDAVCLLDSRGLILRCNRAFRELVGMSFSGLLDQSYTQVLRDGLHLENVPALEELGRPGACEPRELHLGQRWFRHKADPIINDRQNWIGSVHILTDITRQNELEEQLRQAQKLEAIGRLAGGIAHDFNNLLTAILGNVALLQRDLEEGAAGYALAGAIEQAAWRAAELTRQLLGFSRQTLLWLKATDLNDPIGEVTAQLRGSLPPNIALEVTRTEPLWMVQADPIQIAQVLGNLCRNAVDAMPAGGVLRLRSENVVIEENQTRPSSESRPGPFVCITVSDTGEGIPDEVLPRIFDPFFTTKAIGKGTGLGLAMVYGIIKQHQGWVECHSEFGRGATFAIYLPRIS